MKTAVTYESVINQLQDNIADYYFNLTKLQQIKPVKIVDPEWNDWLKENQHLDGPMGLRKINP